MSRDSWAGYVTLSPGLPSERDTAHDIYKVISSAFVWLQLATLSTAERNTGPLKGAGKLHFLGEKKEKRIMLWSLFSVTPAECIYTVIYARGSCLEFALMQFKDLLTKFGVHTIENNPNSQIPSLFLWKKKKLFSMQSKMKEKFWNGICDGRAGNSSSKQKWPLKMKKNPCTKNWKSKSSAVLNNKVNKGNDFNISSLKHRCNWLLSSWLAAVEDV